MMKLRLSQFYTDSIMSKPSKDSHVSSSTATSTGGGCSIATLVGTAEVYIPSVSVAEQGRSETLSHSATQIDKIILIAPTTIPLAVSTLISSSEPTVCVSASVSPVSLRPAV